MKRVKNCNGYVIYEAKSQRDVDNYNCQIGNFNIYTSTGIRDFGLTNSYPEYQDIDSLAEAIAICSGSMFAVADALADELSMSTAQDMDLVLEIERRLESGEALDTIRRCYDSETGVLYSSISEAIDDGFDPYANDDEFGPYEDLNMGSEPDEVDLLCKAMTAAGYNYAPVESYIGWLVFRSDYGDPLHFITWQAVREWLEGVVFDDPEVSDAVERILHPEHFSGRTWLDSVVDQYIADCRAEDEDLCDGDLEDVFEAAILDAEANKNNWRVSDRLTDDLRDELTEGVGCYDTIEEIEYVGMWGLASLELGYGCIEVNVTRPEGDTICAEYFVCLQEADGEWFSHGYIDRLVTIDWSAPDWEDRLHYEMYDELLRYASYKDWDLTTPFVDEEPPASGLYAAEQCPVEEEPEPEEEPKPERRSHASYAVLQDPDDGQYYTISAPSTEGFDTQARRDDWLLCTVAKHHAFNDCGGYDVLEVVVDGRRVEYVGWQPGMLYEFADCETGEIVWSASFPEWDH